MGMMLLAHRLAEILQQLHSAYILAVVFATGWLGSSIEPVTLLRSCMETTYKTYMLIRDFLREPIVIAVVSALLAWLLRDRKRNRRRRR